MYERKKIPSSSSSFAKGNLSNQKYEALWNIKHHFQTVVNASPSRETSRWKHADDFQVIKHQGKRQLLDKNVEKSNLELTQRMFNVLTEERASRTKEYVPGYRVGRGGTVIDCYESSCQRFYEYKIDTKRKVRVLREQKIQHDNTFIAKYIDAARSSCDRKDLKRSYEGNRVLYNFLASRTPHTALHLGLLQKANFEFHKGSVRKVASPIRRCVSSSGPNDSNTSKILPQDASIEEISVVNDLDDLNLRHVNSKLELNTSRGGYYAHKLQPMFAECARYATESGPTAKKQPSNQRRSVRNDTTQNNSSEIIIDAELSDYIANGGPVQGLRKLQALREQRAMQPQSPYGIIQEESQTLSHWSDLCAEVDAEMISKEDLQRRELQEPDEILAQGDALDKRSSLTFEVDEYAAMEQLSPELVAELGPELSILYGTLFARKAALEQQHQDYEEQEVEEQQEEVQQEDSNDENDVYEGHGEDTKEDQENENVEHKVDVEVISADSGLPTLSIADEVQELKSFALKRNSIASPNSRSGRRAAIALVSVNTQKDSRFLFEGKKSLVEMSVNRTMDSTSYSYHVRGFMSDGEPYFLRNERNEIDDFGDETSPTRGESDSAAETIHLNRRTWISMNIKRGASVWTSLVRENPLLSPLWEDDRGKRQSALQLRPRNSLLCQCAMVPPVRSAVNGQNLSIKTLSDNRVDAFLLSIMDVGFRLPGSKKPPTNDGDLAENSLSVCEQSVGSTPIPCEFGTDGEPPTTTADAFDLDSNSSNRYTLSASTGILVELVPILSAGFDLDPASDDREDASDGRAEKSLYCSQFLSVRELLEHSQKYGYSDLYCTLSDLLHYPLDVMDGRGPPPPRRSSSNSFDFKSNSHSSAHPSHPNNNSNNNNNNNNSSSSSSKSNDSSNNNINSTGSSNSARSELYSSLSTVLDAESEKHLFDMISKKVYVVYASTKNSEMKFL